MYSASLSLAISRVCSCLQAGDWGIAAWSGSNLGSIESYHLRSFPPSKTRVGHPSQTEGFRKLRRSFLSPCNTRGTRVICGVCQLVLEYGSDVAHGHKACHSI